MELIEKTINSTELYKGRIFTIKHDRVELPDEGISYRDIVVMGNAVGIVPIEEENGEKFIYLIEQFRYATGQTLLEIPAGKIDEGEEPEATAQRELQEEIEKYPNTLKLLCAPFVSPGCTTEKIYIYLATNLEDKARPKDKDEFLNVLRMPLADAVDMVRVGLIEDGKTIIGITMAASL